MLASPLRAAAMAGKCPGKSLASAKAPEDYEPHLLLFSLHNAVFRVLAQKVHHNGLAMAAKWHWKAGKIDNKTYKRFKNLDTAYHVVRHISQAFVQGFLAEVVTMTESCGTECCAANVADSSCTKRWTDDVVKTTEGGSDSSTVVPSMSSPRSSQRVFHVMGSGRGALRRHPTQSATKEALIEPALKEVLGIAKPSKDVDAKGQADNRQLGQNDAQQQCSRTANAESTMYDAQNGVIVNTTASKGHNEVAKTNATPCEHGVINGVKTTDGLGSRGLNVDAKANRAVDYATVPEGNDCQKGNKVNATARMSVGRKGRRKHAKACQNVGVPVG